MNSKLIKLSALILILAATSAVAEETSEDQTTLVFPPYLHTLGIRKATKYHLFLFLQNQVKFSDPQALAVTRLASWDDPENKKDDDEVTVYGVNSGQHNIIYNKSMTSLGVYGLNEKKEHRLNSPRGIAANSNGDVYVADTGNNRIVHLNNDGKKLKFIKEINVPDQRFSGPNDIALDSKDNLYIADTENDRIVVLDKEHTFLHEFGNIENLMSSPTAIAVIDRNLKWSYYRDDCILVVDLDRSRIQKFSLEGHLIAAVNTENISFPQAELMYIACDYYNNIYVTDGKYHCVHKFDRELQYLTTFGRKGKGDNEFIDPRGIAIYRRFGQIFVAEKDGAQYYWVGTDAQHLLARHHADKPYYIYFEYFLTEPSTITADVFNTNGQFVTRIYQGQFKWSGKNRDLWNGRLYTRTDSSFVKENLVPAPQYQELKTIPNGSYRVRYKFEPTYSSRRYFSKELSVNINFNYE